MGALTDDAAQAFLDGVVEDAVILLVGAEVANSRRDGLADEPIHHHVGVFGIDPDADASDVLDSAGLIADDQIGFLRDREPHRRRIERLHPPDVVLQPVGRDRELRVLDPLLLQLLEQLVRASLHDPHVFAIEAAALADAVTLADLGEIQKDALGGAAGGGKEFADQLRLLDPVTGLLERLTDDGILGRFVAVDHSGDRLGDPAVGGRRIIAAPRNQARHLELIDHHDRMGFWIVEEHRDRIPALENQPALIGTHRPVETLMGNHDFVDLEEIVEQAGLFVNLRPAGTWH